MIQCPAFIITAPASGQGKTTVTAALARYYRDQGLRVRVFKTGPDFLDPMILERASGLPVYQLDLWMGDENQCRELLYTAAAASDLILIEGVMGLFDGNPSSADLAIRFQIPVLAVIDGSAMAQTFSALAHGLGTYHPDLSFAGVIANRVASQAHYEMLTENLPQTITTYGWLMRSSDITLPERHLGLVQAEEISDIDRRIACAADTLNLVKELLPTQVEFNAPTSPSAPAQQLAGLTIAVARDAAFAFLYQANLDLLIQMGAKLIFFSPLTDETLPVTDALYLPGGYPELHLDRLSGNQAMQSAIREHYHAGKAIVAECGGMLYLLESLTDLEGHTATMAGLLPGNASMQKRLTNLGLHQATLPEGELRGHTFHHSLMVAAAEPITYSIAARHHGTGEPVFRAKRLTASYLHWYFPSNPVATAQLFLA